MAQAAPPRVRPTTWSFVLRLQMPNSRFLDCRGSSRCVPLHFQRHSTSNLWIGRLLFFLRSAGRQFRTHSLIFALFEQDCGSPVIPVGPVQGWFSEARIQPKTTRWTPVWPGKNRDWRQDPQILAISAACEDGSRQLEHCIKGSRPDAAWKGGRHRKTPVAPGEGDSAAAGGAGVKRGRPPNPSAAVGDNLEQADVPVPGQTRQNKHV